MRSMSWESSSSSPTFLDPLMGLWKTDWSLIVDYIKLALSNPLPFLSLSQSADSNEHMLRSHQSSENWTKCYYFIISTLRVCK